ncbi:MAG TPA: ankyrin repeat domain-containing protein [Verrucomicrobiae bacterium]|nr:ankyrin repeat domain-containing protein [Verrucomicrobiae bacterium]
MWWAKSKIDKSLTFEQLMSRSFGKKSSSFWSNSPRGLQIEDIQRYLESGGEVNQCNANNDTLLHLAAANGCEDVAKLLLARGAHINAKDLQGYTPLHLAVDGDCDTTVQDGKPATGLPMVKLLIEAGADESARDEDGEIPRDTAVAYGKVFAKLYDAISKRQGK